MALQRINTAFGPNPIRFNGNVQPQATGNVFLGNISNRFATIYGTGANFTGNVEVTGNIMPGGANITYNLGSTTSWWNTFYGVSTQAKYADLAENYVADSQYEPGTVLEFGGSAEVTVAEDGSRKVAGVVSSNPAHLMNGSLSGPNVIALALIGRVPCKVRGRISKGDMLVSAGSGFARPDHSPIVGSIIGKSLEDFNGTEGIIEIVVGKT